MDDHRNPQDQRDDILYLLGQVDTNVKALLISREAQELRITALERWKTRVGMIHTGVFACLPVIGYYIPDLVKHIVKGTG